MPEKPIFEEALPFDQSQQDGVIGQPPSRFMELIDVEIDPVNTPIESTPTASQRPKFLRHVQPSSYGQKHSSSVSNEQLFND